ncbi:hypothetical protein KCP69_03295 [Salmonella enterica subsp. enterica]|nr:hypothetical protein KCP69_03295 [Salmonella enterica subsp. enterica]
MFITQPSNLYVLRQFNACVLTLLRFRWTCGLATAETERQSLLPPYLPPATRLVGG